jgi:hypothetical protein
LKEKVDAEAAAAEAEEPEEEPVEPVEGDDGEEEAEDQQAGEPVEEPEAKGGKKKDPKAEFDKAFSTFGRALKRLFEVEDLEPAPHDGVVGFMIPGFAVPQRNENYKRCATCNGIGKVLTDAQTGDPNKDWHVCPDQRCKGNGFWTKAPAGPAPVETGPLAVVAGAAENGEFEPAASWLGDTTLTPTA